MKKSLKVILSCVFLLASFFVFVSCKDAHVHTFAQEWTFNASEHWHKATCEHTEEVSDKAAHTFGEWQVKTAATETAEGVSSRTCSVCGYEETKSIDKLPHTHTFSSDWSHDEENHWHASTCGHEDQLGGLEAHTFGEWQVITEATENEDGLKRRTCSVCGYVDEEEIARLSHTHTFAEAWTSNATTHWHATTCGHDVKADEAEHTFGEWNIVTDPTEEQVGLKTRTCSVCGYVDEQEIEKLPHTHKFADTWTSNATTHYHASTCGHDVKADEAEHTFGEWNTVTEAGYLTKGSKERTCSVCGYKETAEIPARDYMTSAEIKAYIAKLSLPQGKVVLTYSLNGEGQTQSVEFKDSILKLTDSKGVSYYKFADNKLYLYQAYDNYCGSEITNDNSIISNSLKDGINLVSAVKALSESADDIIALLTAEDASYTYNQESKVYSIVFSGKSYSSYEAVVNDYMAGNLSNLEAYIYMLQYAKLTQTGLELGCDYESEGASVRINVEALTQDVVIPTHTHVYSTDYSYDNTYHWHDAICSDAEGEDAISGKEAHEFGEWVVIDEATEDKDGLKRRSCACGYYEEEVIPQIGYEFDRFEWTKTEGAFTAVAVFVNVAGNEKRHNARVTSEITTEPTCEGKGVRTYTVLYDSYTETETEEVAPLGHDWNEPVYALNDAKDGIVGTITCKHDENHKVTETVGIAKIESEYATCEKDGLTTYTSEAFTNELFAQAVAKVTVVLEKTGHDWNEPTYELVRVQEELKIVGTVTCKNDPTHILTETVGIKKVETKYATCEEDGLNTYTSEPFTNELFSQTGAVVTTVLEKTGHDWNEPVYALNDAKDGIIGTITCKHDENHKVTETVGIAKIESEYATCEKDGLTTYTSEAFTNELFAQAVAKVTVVLEKKGHDWNEPTYVWSDDNSTVTATRICKNDSEHVETETVNTTSTVTTQSTCTVAGKILYTSAAFENDAFEIQSKTIDAPLKEHKYVPVAADCSYDSTTQKVTAKVKCNVCNHEETFENVEVVDYTAVDENTGLVALTGIITSISSGNVYFGNSEFELYRVKKSDTSINYILGDRVVVYGKTKMFSNNVLGLEENCVIVLSERVSYSIECAQNDITFTGLPANSNNGETISFTVAPVDNSKKVSKVTANGIELFANELNEYSFEVIGNVEIQVILVSKYSSYYEYVKATSTDQLSNGTQITFYNEDNSNALKMYDSSVKVLPTVNASLNSEDRLYDGSGISFITLEATEGGWYFVLQDGKYLNTTKVKEMKYEDEASTVWTITFDNNGVVTVAPVGSDLGTMRYNYNSGNPRFTTYASGQSAIDVYIRTLGRYPIDAVAPTCDEPGTIKYYTDGEKKYSAFVGGEELSNVIDPALGHDYQVTSSAWTNTGDLTVQLTCKNDTSHTVSLDSTNLQQAGYFNIVSEGTGYVATITYNSQEFILRNAQYEITINGADNLEVLVKQGENVIVGVNNVYTFDYGVTATIFISNGHSASRGYFVDSVKLDGNDVSEYSPSFNIENITANHIITVVANELYSFNLVEDMADLDFANNSYAFLYVYDNHAFDGSKSGSDISASGNCFDVVTNGNNVFISEEKMSSVIYIGEITGGYYLKTYSGFYIGYSDNKGTTGNNVTRSNTEIIDNNIVIDTESKNVTISSEKANSVFRYNNGVFRYYTSSTGVVGKLYYYSITVDEYLNNAKTCFSTDKYEYYTNITYPDGITITSDSNLVEIDNTNHVLTVKLGANDTNQISLSLEATVSGVTKSKQVNITSGKFYNVTEAYTMISALDAGGFSSTSITVKGVIKSFTNNRPTITDGANDLLCYSTFSGNTLYVGDTIVVQGYGQNYQGTTPEMVANNNTFDIVERIAGDASVLLDEVNSSENFTNSMISFNSTSGKNGDDFTFTIDDSKLPAGFAVKTVKINNTVVTPINDVYSGKMCGTTLIVVVIEEFYTASVSDDSTEIVKNHITFTPEKGFINQTFNIAIDVPDGYVITSVKVNNVDAEMVSPGVYSSSFNNTNNSVVVLVSEAVSVSLSFNGTSVVNGECNIENASISVNGNIVSHGSVTFTINPDFGYKISSVSLGEPTSNSGEYTILLENDTNVLVSIVKRTYTLVTDASQLQVGQKIIIVNTGLTKALSNTQNNNNRGTVDITSSVLDGNSAINNVGIITLGKASKNDVEYWTLSTDDGYLYAASSSSNYLKSKASVDDACKWSINISNNEAEIVSQGSYTHNILRNNGNLFACYLSGQTAIKIYVYTEN